MWELLAPAGSYESIIAAVNAGADAVYAGGRLFGARAYADNPDEERLIRGIEYCHIHGRKLYLTVNTLLKEQELETLLYPYLLPYYESGVDGLIVQDFGVMSFVREYFPDLPVHASTQMTVAGPEGARLLKAQGVSRVVAARELSLKEIRAIIEEAGVEVEAFIHGAMCYSYSGQCLLSSMIGGRSGNRGRCAQPCRLPYRIQNVQSPSAAHAAGQSGRDRELRPMRGGRDAQDSASFLLSMKDMCTLDFLPEILEAGIASLKIEGRMKRPEYTAGVVSVYRKYIDLYRASGREKYRVEEADRSVLLDLYNRGGFSEGYYHAHNGRHMMATDRPNHRGTPAIKVQAGKGGSLRLTALEALGKGDVIELAPGREVTLGEDVKKAEPVRLPAVRGWRPEGGVLYRTRNAGLLARLNTQYLSGEAREKISGALTVPADAPAVLRLVCRGVHAECELEIAEPARQQPVDVEFVRRQMQKTGGTPFVFERLDISLAEGVFVPVAKLNELRRTGLLRLQEKLLADGRRTAATRGNAHEKEAARVQKDGAAEGETEERAVGGLPRAEKDFRVNILVTTGAQLEAVLECEDGDLDTVYLDSLLFGTMQDQDAVRVVETIKRSGRHCFLNCPGVLRERERTFLLEPVMQSVMRGMDGFLLHTFDELAFFTRYIRENGLTAVLAADDNLYAYNRRAVKFLQDRGVGRFTLPAELNFRELSGLRTAHAELNVYGYQALMQSAQCVVKNTGGCTGIPGITYLVDRKNIRFPVLNRCLFCHNTIYNSVPLMLCGCREEIRRLAPDFVRLSFTVESKEETEQALRACRDILRGEEMPERFFPGGTTRGHFRRGVE